MRGYARWIALNLKKEGSKVQQGFGFYIFFTFRYVFKL